jgi:hypothetical protein
LRHGLVLVLALFLLDPAAPASSLSLDDPHLVAWTAWYARETGERENLPDLRAFLRRPLRSRNEVFARIAVIDALVTLNARVTAAEVLPAVRDSGLTVGGGVVLAVRNADDATRLAVFDVLDAAESADDRPWLAMVNCIAGRKIPGAAFRLLSGFDTNLVLFVSDRPREKRHYRPPYGSVPGDGIVTMPDGFPPISVYRLFEYPDPGDEILADGWKPIGWCRSGETAGGQRFWVGCAGGIRRHEVRLRWIADLLETEVGKLPIERWPCRTVGFPSGKVLRQRVQRIREEIAGDYREVGRRFVDAGLMTEAELGRIRPGIRIKVIDVRLRKDREIPPLTPPEPKERGNGRPVLR